MRDTIKTCNRLFPPAQTYHICAQHNTRKPKSFAPHNFVVNRIREKCFTNATGRNNEQIALFQIANAILNCKSINHSL